MTDGTKKASDAAAPAAGASPEAAAPYRRKWPAPKVERSNNKMNFDDLINQKEIVFNSEWDTPEDKKGLCDADLDVLTEVVQKSEVLEELHLRQNQIALADGKFTDALASNRTILRLHLERNQIGAEGAKRLADALVVNKTLQKLWLTRNRFLDEGAESLAPALKVNTTLQEIWLSGVGISDEGAKTFADARSVNKSGLKVMGLTLQDWNFYPKPGGLFAHCNLLDAEGNLKKVENAVVAEGVGTEVKVEEEVEEEKVQA